MRTRFPPLVAFVVLAALTAGCQTTPTRIPNPPRAPELLSAAPLAIDAACEVDGAVQVEYTILQSGETGNIEVSDAPACARDALVAWLNSHRYAQQPADTAARFEWILVSARRGS
jgi:hypothetical protein